MQKIGIFSLLISLICVTPAISQETDWQKLLITDAQAMHDELLASHPGVYDAQNPKFKQILENGLVHLKSRAKDVHDYNGYKWALREYAAAFNDGHLSIDFRNLSNVTLKWSGFLLNYENEKYSVAAKDEDDKNTPPIGAQLISCDGKSADKIGFERQGKWRGLWMLEGQKHFWASVIMADVGNPFIKNPTACKFKIDGNISNIKLNWRVINDDDWTKYQQLANYQTKYDFGYKEVQNGAWISIPSFRSDIVEKSKEIEKLLIKINQKQEEIRTKDFVIIDLRGNDGGNAQYVMQLSQIIWGDGIEKAFYKTLGDEVSWRASEHNIQFLKSHNYGSGIYDGMEQSIKEHQPYFNFKISNMAGENPQGKINPPTAKIFLISYNNCASACLTAVDLFKELGATQVGQVTAADTYYMDVRDFELPSHNASLNFAMNKITGRKRGINQPQIPDIQIQDITNDADILAAIQADISKTK